MIKSLYVNNYKSFVNFSITFDQISVLIGKNGSGKSNLLTLLAAIAAFSRGQINARSCFPTFTLTKWMQSDIQTFELVLSDSTALYEYRLEIQHHFEDASVHVLKESIRKDGRLIVESLAGTATVTLNDNSTKDFLVDDSLSVVSMLPDNSVDHSIRLFKEMLGSIIICTPNPKSMQEMIVNDVFLPMADFENIASAYTGVTQMHPEIINDLWKAMKETDAAFVRSRVGLNNYYKYLALVYEHNGKENEYHFSELSDGERMLFSLYLLLYGYIMQGMTVLLDEPDNYLSLREIQPWCMEIEQLFETNGQCIMVSHHPEVIDYYADNNGIWFSRLSSGETVIEENPYYKKDEERTMKYSELIARGTSYEV